MIKRYSRKEMKKIWEERNKFRLWLKIEKTLVKAKVNLNLISPKTAKIITTKSYFTIKRIDEIEDEVEHDMLAFIMTVQEEILKVTGAEKIKYSEKELIEAADEFHKGATSYDIEEPTLVFQLKEALGIIIKDVETILDIMKKQAERYRWTEMTFKTHGQIAELGTLGLKILNWYDMIERSHKHLQILEEEISVCKFSGAVGTYSTLGPEVEEEIARILKLKPARIATQILSRDYHARIIFELAMLASVIDKIALDIRLHAVSEIGELHEPAKPKRKGSSAMPHKRNPILLERLCGLSRNMRADTIVVLFNISLWDERDISHSGPERITIPDAFILLDYMLSKLAYIAEGLQVYPKKMQENIDRTYGTLFSQQVKIFLLNSGVNPEVVYRLVQESSFKAIDQKKHISIILAESPVFSDLNIDILALKTVCFEPRSQIKHVDEIFARFGL